MPGRPRSSPRWTRPPSAWAWPPGRCVNLDFHAVMHWGEDPALEKHYVPSRSQRTRSVLTFFAEDADTHALLYANADLAKATQSRGGDRLRRPLEDRHRPRPGPARHGLQGHHPGPALAP